MMRMRAAVLGFSSVFDIGGAANGLFMLADPVDWYFAVPGVTNTGPFNQHFVRDIGLTFLLISVAMLVGILRPERRAFLWAAAAFWLSGHAIFHLWEVSVGICGPNAIVRDFPLVTLPALAAIALAIWAWRDGHVAAAVKVKS